MGEESNFAVSVAELMKYIGVLLLSGRVCDLAAKQAAWLQIVTMFLGLRGVLKLRRTQFIIGCSFR